MNISIIFKDLRNKVKEASNAPTLNYIKNKGDWVVKEYSDTKYKKQVIKNNIKLKKLILKKERKLKN